MFIYLVFTLIVYRIKVLLWLSFAIRTKIIYLNNVIKKLLEKKVYEPSYFSWGRVFFYDLISKSIITLQRFSSTLRLEWGQHISYM